MLKILLKKQLTESFQNFLIDRKTNSKRSKVKTIGFFAFYFLLIMICLGTMMTQLSLNLSVLLQGENSFLYHTVTTFTSVLMGVFGSSFTSFSTIYKPRDNELLLSMPIKISDIVFSRIFCCLIINEMYIVPCFVPSTVVGIIVRGADANTIICAVLDFLIVSMLTFVLSSVFGYIIGIITSRSRHKNLVSTVVSMLFIVILYPLMYEISSICSFFIKNEEKIAVLLRTKVVPLYWLGAAGNGNIISSLLILIVCVVACILCCLVISKSFLKISTGVNSVDTSERKTDRKKIKQKKLIPCLVSRELKRFFSSSTIVLNCGLGSVFLIFLSIFAVFDTNYIQNLVYTLQVFLNTESSGIIILSVMEIVLVSFNTYCSCSLSLEGNTMWIIKSSPVTPKQIFLSRIITQFILCEPSLIIFAVVLGIKIKIGALAIIMNIIFTILLCLFLSSLELLFNLRFININWKNESYAVKQGFNVFLPTVVMIGVALFVLAMCLIVKSDYSIFYSFLQIILMVILNAIIQPILLKSGVKKFKEIE